MRLSVLIGLALTLGTPAVTQEQKPAADASPSALRQIRSGAGELELLFKTPLVKAFLRATVALPPVKPRRIFHDASRTSYYTEAEAARLTEEQRASLETLELDETFYYNTKYGTPLAYSRPLDLLARSGLDKVAGKKVLDFGYGGIGHLRLLASLGAEVVGVEVDPLLRALYSEPEDHGRIEGYRARSGSITLVHGQFPATEEVRTAVGGGFDVILSKNVLKNGYIHPAEEVDPKRLVHLGVDDGTFVKALHGILNPGGLVMIYNLCPAPAPPGEPYIPWADGRSPFSADLWESAGFEVLAIDVDDSRVARGMARALGWDQGEHPMNPEKDLFGIYTLVKKATNP